MENADRTLETSSAASLDRYGNLLIDGVRASDGESHPFPSVAGDHRASLRLVESGFIALLLASGISTALAYQATKHPYGLFFGFFVHVASVTRLIFSVVAVLIPSVLLRMWFGRERRRTPVCMAIGVAGLGLLSGPRTHGWTSLTRVSVGSLFGFAIWSFVNALRIAHRASRVN